MNRARLFLVLVIAACDPASAKVAVMGSTDDGRSCKVRFSFMPQIAVKSVSVAGSFNGWHKDELKLRPDESGGWSLTAGLPCGRYSYKFVVDGETWLPDPEPQDREPDGFEGFNSVFTAGPAAGPAGVLPMGAVHGPGIEFREWVRAEKTAVLRVETSSAAAQALLMLGTGERRPMARVVPGGSRALWELEVPSTGAFRYSFELVDGGTRTRLGPAGGFLFDPAKAPSLDVPEWAAGAVFYQIFPERFADGDPANDPPGSEAWGAAPAISNHFGGDLKGVLDRLPYLAELGVDAVYLNPVFESPSSHKYDTADYLKIDPHFGDERLLRRLARALHARKMRLVLDGVFNHSGDRFWAFQDVLAKGKASKYASWYTLRGSSVTQSPPNYECWWGFSHLPKLDTGDPEARRYLLGVGEHWLRAGADGWRLDVPNEVPHAFWRDFRRTVRSAKPDAYIVGEIWNDGLPWLGGDEFDAVMNYVFRSAVLGYFAQGDVPLKELDQRLLEQRHRYPRSSLPVQFNLLGSHDTARLRTVFKGDLARLRLAVLFQMTYPGAPVVYYGDEVGLEGDKDPDCRRCFPWEPERQERGLLGHYRKLASLRRSRPELRRGSFRTLLVDSDKDVYAFARELAGRTVAVVLHRGAGRVSVSLPLPAPLAGAAELEDLYAGGKYPAKDGALGLELGPSEGLILAPPASAR